jgi:hypothetical protein
VTGTQAGGPTGPPSSTNIGRLKIGETKAFGIYVDWASKLLTATWRGSDEPSDCSWRVDVRPLSVQIDTVRFELAWTRYEGSGAAAHRVASDTRVVTLRKGQRHVIDLARAPSGETDLANVVAEVELTEVLDPQYQNLAIAYELSLVHELTNGQKLARGARLTGTQGENRPFSFELPFTLDGAAATGNVADAGPTVVTLRVTGVVSSRLKMDGTFDVELHAERVLDCGGGTVGRGTGTQRFRAANGETVGVEFPTVAGACSPPIASSVPPGARAGVTLRDGHVWVAFNEFFANQKTALLVKVLRQRDP